MASGDLLARAIGLVGEAGWLVAAVDVTITGARPRLGSHLDAVRVRVAELLGLAASHVSIKASTGNLQGHEGAGRTIAAAAIATLRRTR